MENSIKQNKHVQGDAAFADYVVNLGFSVKFKQELYKPAID